MELCFLRSGLMLKLNENIPFGAYFKTLLTIANNRSDGFQQ